jgi:hypothetical protein
MPSSNTHGVGQIQTCGVGELLRVDEYDTETIHESDSDRSATVATYAEVVAIALSVRRFEQVLVEEFDMKKQKLLAPAHAKTLDEVCSLRTDNFNIPSGWILTDGDRVTIAKQKAGEASTESVSFSRKEFNRLVSWYFRPQRTVKRSSN